jgi:hypothetical protein
MCGISWLFGPLLSSQAEFCSMELANSHQQGTRIAWRLLLLRYNSTCLPDHGASCSKPLEI